MKKNLLKCVLLALMVLVGGNAWAQTTTLMEYGTENVAWTTDNLAEWTAGGSPTITDGYVAITGKNGSYSTSKTINPTENAIINVKAVWRGRSNTGRAFSAGNGSYFRFGNIIVAQNDQDKKHGYGFKGLSNIKDVTTFAAGSYRVDISSCTWLLIEMEINTASNTLTSFAVKSEDGNTTYASAQNVGLEDADYSTIAFGYHKSGSVSTDNAEQLKSVKVTQTVQAVETANYTVKFVCNNTEVKEASVRTGVVGQNITLNSSDTENFYTDNMKYIYVSNDAEGKTIAEGAVVTVTFREAEKFAWTAKSSVGTYSISGETWEGDKATVKYPLYQLVDGKLWTKAAISQVYAQTFDITENNQELTLTYTETEIPAVFYAEVEDLENMSAYAASNAEARCSQRAAGYSADGNTLITSLPQGKYKMVASFYSPTSAGGKYNFFTGNRNIWSATTGNANATLSDQEVVLAKESNEISLGQGAYTQAVDYIYIQSLGEPTSEELEAAQAADQAADEAAALAAAKTALQTAINEAKAIDTTDKEGVEALQTAIATAEAALAAEDATTESLTAAKNALAEAVAAFEEANNPAIDLTDVTSLITNNSFETGDLTGWTAERTDGDTGVKTNVSPYTTEGIDGSYLFNTWNGDATGYGITQTLTALPADYYKLEADFAGLIGSKVDLIAGDMTTTVTHTATGVFTTAEVLFHNAEAADVIIGTTNATGWYKVDNFRLHTITAEQYLAPIIAEYQDLRTTASTIAAMESGISTAYKTIAANAIAECDALNPSDESGYRTAIGALQKAIETAQKSINAYNMIVAGTIPTDNAAGWNKTTTNGTLACNTWSTEGNSDGSGMTTPFIQNWVGAGNPLGEGQLSYTLEGLEPGEKYNVSALVRVFNEAEGSLEGASFFANNQSIDVDAEGNACTGDYATKGIYGTFTAKAVEVGEDGTLTFGIAIADGSLLNWVAIKNVTISEYANQKVESITLSQSSATITTGDALTLIATVAPENADDKTFTWSSTNEAVATVNALGIVTALAAGNATITATANDGSGVTASCTVTVADAAAIANATVITGTGEYLLRNVATGKYLGQGNDYGTRASINDHAVWVTATKQDDGTYKLTGICANSGLGSNGYVDNGTPAALTVALVEGETNIYTLSAAEGQYTAVQAGSTIVVMNGTDATSKLAQWQFIAQTEANKNLVTATAENPVDVTYMIRDANFSRNVDSSVWTMESSNQNLSGGSDLNRNAESWHATFTLSQELTVPNGTYRLRAQAAANGNPSNVFVYANDETKPFNAIANGENSMNAMSTSFTNGLYYTDWVEVTVTDHTLTVGAKTTETGSWCIWDNFELEMIGYVPVTEIAANINKTEITEGSTATISNIATVPAAASFNAYTISSDNEEVATVTPAGVVTAIKAGSANITIAAEMENVTKVFAITVVEPVAAPESIALKNGEEAAADMILHGSTLTATLTADVLPQEAPQAVDWVSSDESVATVLNGVITAVSTGEATITARSVEDTNISASINVKVYMFLNNSFEADGNQAAGNGTNPNIITITGWTQEQNSAGSFQDNQLRDANTDNASNYGKKVTPSNGNYYFFYRHGWNGSNYAKLTSEAQNLPVGKYTLSVDYKMVSGSDNTTNNDNTAITLSAISGENTLGTVTKNDATKANNNSSTAYLTNEAWKTATTTFTLEESKSVQAVINLMACGPKRSDFVIDNVTLTWSSFKDALNDAIAEANEVDVTTNVGTAAFQIPTAAATTFTSAISDAQGVYDDAESEETDYLNAIKALATATSTWENSELNEPDAEKLYNIVVSTTGHAKENNPIIVIPGATSANNPTGYALNANFASNTNLSQAFTFTKVEGNNYKISAKVGGVDVYLTNGSLNGSAAGWKDSQIQATTDVEKAMAFKIAVSTTEGSFNIYNTVTNSTIACQSGGNIYTEAGNADFSVVETTKPSIEINTTAAGWGTVMLPFAQDLPEGVKAYTCAATEGDRLTLTEVKESLEANKPYLVEGSWNANVSGDAQGTALNYTEGLFTGVYEATAAPVGSYVLQNKNDKLGFYKVAEGKQPTVGANHAYLTVPASVRDAFFFGDGETTAISALKALSEGNVEIYNTNGVRIPSLQKGMNILKMSDGTIKKVMVK